MSSTALTYRICSQEEWATALSEGSYKGGELDAKDGFIHLSTALQCVDTVRLYFAARPDLVLLEIPALNLGEALKWEYVDERGETFPHLYAPAIRVVDVSKIIKLPLNEEGVHIFPAGFGEGEHAAQDEGGDKQ